jgi:hypothetical protein
MTVTPVTGSQNLSWAASNKQYLLVGLGCTGATLYMSAAPTGMSANIIFKYNVVANVLGWTGVKWPSAAAPVLSGDTGATDIVAITYDGINYYGQAITNFK